VPLSCGGEHSYANTQAAHPYCNRSKRNRPMSHPDVVALSHRKG
jgi:5-methylcytosine-specific restriction endonuclease McrA